MNIVFGEMGLRRFILFLVLFIPLPCMAHTLHVGDLEFPLYSTKTTTPVRDFIPVPAGLQIGNFTVPSNGMWDIVEQKFYGNSGTGDFVYGVDE